MTLLSLNCVPRASDNSPGAAAERQWGYSDLESVCDGRQQCDQASPYRPPDKDALLALGVVEKRLESALQTSTGCCTQPQKSHKL